jgi:hypothetical protein
MNWQNSITRRYLLLGAFYVYFTRIAGRDDFAIGLPVLNRTNAYFKKRLVGINNNDSKTTQT